MTSNLLCADDIVKHQCISKLLAHLWSAQIPDPRCQQRQKPLLLTVDVLDGILLKNKCHIMYSTEMGKIFYKHTRILLCWGKDLDFSIFCKLITKGHPILGLCNSYSKFDSIIHIPKAEVTSQEDYMIRLVRLWNRLKSVFLFCSYLVDDNNNNTNDDTCTTNNPLFEEFIKLFKCNMKSNYHFKLLCLKYWGNDVFRKDNGLLLSYNDLKQVLDLNTTKWKCFLKRKPTMYRGGRGDINLSSIQSWEQLEGMLQRIKQKQRVPNQHQQHLYKSINIHPLYIDNLNNTSSSFTYSNTCTELHLTHQITCSGVISEGSYYTPSLAHCDVLPYEVIPITTLTSPPPPPPPNTVHGCCPVGDLIYNYDSRFTSCIKYAKINKLIYSLSIFEMVGLFPQSANEYYYEKLIKSKINGRKNVGTAGGDIYWKISHEWNNNSYMDKKWIKTLNGIHHCKTSIATTTTTTTTTTKENTSLNHLLNTLKRDREGGLSCYEDEYEDDVEEEEEEEEEESFFKSKSLFTRLMSDPAYTNNYDEACPEHTTSKTSGVPYHYNKGEKLDLLPRYTLDTCLFKHNPSFLLDVILLLSRYNIKSINTLDHLVKFTKSTLKSLNTWYLAARQVKEVVKDEDVVSYYWVNDTYDECLLKIGNKNDDDSIPPSYIHIYLNSDNEPRYVTKHFIELPNLPSDCWKNHKEEEEEEDLKRKRLPPYIDDNDDNPPPATWLLELLHVVSAINFGLNGIITFDGSDQWLRKSIYTALTSITNQDTELQSIHTSLLNDMYNFNVERLHPIIFVKIFDVFIKDYHRESINWRCSYWPNIPLYLLGFLTRDLVMNYEEYPPYLILLNYLRPKVKIDADVGESKPGKYVISLIKFEYNRSQTLQVSIYPINVIIYKLYDSSKLTKEQREHVKIINLEQFEQNILQHTQLCIELTV